jgi:FkbM family methyltransferase
MLGRIKNLFRDTSWFERAAALRQRKLTYSQFGEDAHLESYYGRLAFDRKIVVNSGCVVDVGSCRPIVGSNSYAFHKRGWGCINIDPTPGSMLRFNRTRPSDTNLELAIGSDEGEQVFYSFGSPSVWNTLDPEMARNASKKSGIDPVQIRVPVKRLKTILDEHLNGRAFEILSIDAEGHDLSILQSNDFTKYKPRVILIETHNLTLETLQAHEVVTFLLGEDYFLYSWINPNLMFVRSDSNLTA